MYKLHGAFGRSAGLLSTTAMLKRVKRQKLLLETGQSWCIIELSLKITNTPLTAKQSEGPFRIVHLNVNLKKQTFIIDHKVENT